MCKCAELCVSFLELLRAFTFILLYADEPMSFVFAEAASTIELLIFAAGEHSWLVAMSGTIIHIIL